MAIITAIIGFVKTIWKEASILIVYTPLWDTMAQKQVTTYTLRVKHGMSHATVQRLQANLPVSTHTLDKLCRILDCTISDIALYLPDEEK